MAAIQLQTQEHRDLLDIIDNLRTKGLGRYVDLPEIIVCGDQSAGKSSVLEAISGMAFPTKDTLCTRFPMELILRREPQSGVKVSIIAGPDRSAEEQSRLSAFSHEIDFKNPNLADVVEKAKADMGIPEEREFSNDRLRVELHGPSQPHLTLVDLPGIYRAGNTEQSEEGAVLVEAMVKGFMGRDRSIILAVVSAKNEFSLQDVTKYARQLDPEGKRTLGLITKPDTLDAGSDMEAGYAKLAQNKDVKLRLGWHVLKNRDFKMRDASSAQRDEAERLFFAQGIWMTLDSSLVGVDALKLKLSNVLKEHILLQLPSIVSDVNAGLDECKCRLAKLGSSRVTLQEQRRYLLRASQEFTSLVKAAVDGVYNDVFFGRADTDGGYQRRLRAVVQAELHQFAEFMRTKGHRRTIVEGDEEPTSDDISRKDYVQEVKGLMRRNRGRELMGTFNPVIIGDLFQEQCQPWPQIVRDKKDVILRAVYGLVQAVVQHVTAEEVADGLLRLVNASIDTLYSNLEAAITDLLDPHVHGHPITYNHYLTDSVQKAQSARRKRTLEKALKAFFGQDELSKAVLITVNPSQLLSTVDAETNVDMEAYAGELAVDYMQAYCKVARKKFVDDISVLGFEKCVIAQLPRLFSPETVYDLSDADVSRLAGESPMSSEERCRYAEKLQTLETSLQALKRMDKHRDTSAEFALVPATEVNDDSKAETLVANVSSNEMSTLSDQQAAEKAISNGGLDNAQEAEDLWAAFQTKKKVKKTSKAAKRIIWDDEQD